MKKYLPWLLLAILSLPTVSMLSGCDHLASVHSLADNARPKLKPELISLRKENFVPGSQQLVLLVGENHASVETQKQLATLLTGLLEQHALDSVLIEGSNGPVSTETFLNSLQADGNDPSTLEAYWRQELEGGRIAGYEFVALTHASLEVFGVEDMGAKARNKVFLDEMDLRTDATVLVEAVGMAEQALSKLHDAGLEGELTQARVETVEARRAADEYKRATDNYITEQAPDRALDAQRDLLAGDLAPILWRLENARPSIRDYVNWQSEYEKLHEPIQQLKSTLENRKPFSGGSGDPFTSFSSVPDSSLDPFGTSPPTTTTQGVVKAEYLMLVRTNGPRLKTLYEQIRSFDLEHFQDLRDYKRAVKQLQELDVKLLDFANAHKDSVEQFDNARKQAEDAYKIAANRLSDLAAEKHVPIPSLTTFFHEESERLGKQQGMNSPDLEERDTAMAQNTANYLQNNLPANKKVVVLLVGYAHVAGLEAKLAALGVSYLSGELTASEREIEPWEEAAWERRKDPNALVFANPIQELKELSLLLNENWQKEQIAKLHVFKQVDLPDASTQPSFPGLAWESRIFERIGGKDRSMRIGKFPFDSNAIFGTQLVDRGPVPGKPGEFYEVTDREVATELVNELSDGDNQFAFYYRTKPPSNAKPVYQFQTAAGLQPFEAFAAKPPGTSSGTPKRVILFGEADDMAEGDAVYSPLWKGLRSTGGSNKTGAGDKPPDGGAGGKPPGGSAGNEPSSNGAGDKPPGNGAGDKRSDSGAGDKSPGNGAGDKPPAGGDGDKPPGDESGWTGFFLSGEGPRRPRLLRTINPERARDNLKALAKQQPEYLGKVEYLGEEDLPHLDSRLQFTPVRGDHAQTVVFMGRNVPELRAAVRAAGEARLLQGKQVALIMCGDAFGETASLRESLLREGALMVWTNDRQITPDAGRKLQQHIEQVEKNVQPEDRRTIDELIERALRDWHKQAPTDNDVYSFTQSSTWVLFLRSNPARKMCAREGGALSDAA